MRIWLLDILACPICKHYPLDLEILKWETNEKAFSQIESAFKSRQLSALESSCVLTLPNGKRDKCVKFSEDRFIEIEDEFSREKKSLPEYLGDLNGKIRSAQTITDATNTSATTVLDQVRSKATDKVSKTIKVVQSAKDVISLAEGKKILQDILPEMYLLNWYFFLTEIEEGLIICGKCQRWYPVIETIPHMLPDDLRNVDEDIAFLKRWSNKLPQSVLNEGKPFNLKTEISERKRRKPR
ncbi:MAG: Trm112 family protein [Candidatus Atabeyarchaeum deiterrae]